VAKSHRSQEGTSVIGTVILTAFFTLALVFAGWFVTTRYLGQPTASVARAETAVPAPRRRSPRAPKNDSGRSGRQDKGSESPVEAAPGGAPGAAEQDAARGRDESEPSIAAGRETPAGATEAESGGGREAGESPSIPARAVPASTQVDNQDARTIMVESQRRADAKSYQYEGLLQTYDAKGKVTEKRWTFDRLGSHGQSKAVLRFTAPAEVKGVALLIVNHPDRASDQWMWTPAIERDRRIALQDRSTRFFGTDFSFEDLEERDVDQYDYSSLGNETIDGEACWKIQSTPKQGRSSQYSRSSVWVRKDNYALARLDNFVKDEVVRRLNYSSLENIQGIWTARQLEMADLHRASRTRLTLQQVKYNVPMKDEDFTLQAIRR
jgi:hypothetical protein